MQSQARLRAAGAVPIMVEQCTGTSPRGVVVAAAPAAARIGATALHEGGNAFDAAVAAALAETVLLPPKCGLAGDLIALAWARGEAEPTALLAIGGAPGGLLDVVRRGELGPTGPYSVGVPGAPAGYAALAARGRLGIERLAAPAIEAAREGFAWSRICSLLAAESLDLVAANNLEANRFFPGGDIIAPGQVTKLPGLARALEMFAEDPASFLLGPVGRAIVDRVKNAGGILSLDDMRYGVAQWVPTDSLGRDQGVTFVTPAPTHGASLLYAISAFPSNPSPVDVHRAVMEAIRGRRATLADPSGTSMVSAIDGDGTMVTVVHSNSFPRFGSGLIVAEHDLVLSNRAGRGFSSDPEHPNAPVAGRRPATTLHAWAVRQSDGTRLQGATPGGANQMPWNAQSLGYLASDPAGVGEAVIGPRWEWLPENDGLRIESGFSEVEVAGLEASVPGSELTDRWALRSAMQILVDPGPGEALLGVVDPRTGGGISPI